jgi:AcrR family transcriptional regulator
VDGNKIGGNEDRRKNKETSPVVETAAPPDTRQSLLIAAGELFAEKGLEGTSVREIVGKAGATLSAVNYHFGSKQQLYLEAIRHALHEHIRLGDALANARPDQIANEQDAADFLYRLVREFFFNYIAPDQPGWYGRLINRAVIDDHPEAVETIAEVLRPADEILRELLLKHVPNITRQSADFWNCCIGGQIHYFLMARRVIMRLTGRNAYDRPFIEAAAEYVAVNSVRALGLPEPNTQDFSSGREVGS